MSIKLTVGSTSAPSVPHSPLLSKGTLTENTRHVSGTVLNPVIIPIL